MRRPTGTRGTQSLHNDDRGPDTEVQHSDDGIYHENIRNEDLAGSDTHMVSGNINDSDIEHEENGDRGNARTIEHMDISEEGQAYFDKQFSVGKFALNLETSHKLSQSAVDNVLQCFHSHTERVLNDYKGEVQKFLHKKGYPYGFLSDMPIIELDQVFENQRKGDEYYVKKHGTDPTKAGSFISGSQLTWNKKTPGLLYSL